MAQYLGSSGWNVLQADDGETGLKLAREYRPTAVVCDLLLPRLNGFQICLLLRQEPELNQTRIVTISGRGYAANQQMALESGADEFMPKPVAPSELLAVLNRLVGGQPETSLRSLMEPNSETTTVKFWGVRGSVPVPGPATVAYGGNTSCIEVRGDNQIIILDAGTGIRELGRQLASEYKDSPLDLTILISHTHWDHIQGFPFFLPAYQSKNKISIRGYEGARARLAGVLAGQMESPYFPIALRELPGNIIIEELKDLNFSIGKVKIEAAFMNHPGICMGYRLFTSGGSVAYLPDNEPFYRPTGRDDDGSDPETPEDLTFAQSEDSKMVEFIQNADLLIMDAQYDAEEYQSHIGWGHGCVDDVVRLALKAKVKRLLLFHHDPSHDDQKVAAMTEHARQLVAASRSDLIVESAREGATYQLEKGGSKTERFRAARQLGKPLIKQER
jgi:phosphoribosyl 1,2-cyclic phosphodiesterase/CheY-like chemotaxis protein